MPDGVALALALVLLAARWRPRSARPPWLPEALAAAAGAVVPVIVGAIGLARAGDVMHELGPTVAFLACLLLIPDGCRRERPLRGARRHHGPRIARQPGAPAGLRLRRRCRGHGGC